MSERLQKVIANSGITSRRKAEKMIEENRVTVNGETVNTLGTQVSPGDKIEVDGKKIKTEDKVYILLYKPRGVISAVSDDKERKVVTDYLPDVEQRVYPVGRLDYDTSGLLLLTNDGEFANQLMHPKFKVDKTYIAKIEGQLTSEEIRKLEKGHMKIKNYYTAPARVKVISTDKEKNTSIVRITIHEGHNHQVKDMFQKVGHDVKKLSREKYDFLTLDGMNSGDYRYLSDTEVRLLLKNSNKK